jgi:hypothetical protein
VTRQTGTSWPDILDLLDAGRGTGIGSNYTKVFPKRCVRRGCLAACLEGSGFCSACLAWVTGATAEDPLKSIDVGRGGREPSFRPPWSGEYPPASDDEWTAYLRSRT